MHLFKYLIARFSDPIPQELWKSLKRNVILKISILMCIGISSNWAQEQKDYSIAEDISKSSFLSIPPVSAFLLIDVAPNRVYQAGNTRSVKIDWTLRTYKTTPNIAVELQPFWLLYYNNGHIDDYRRASGFYKALSSLSLSVGTVNWGPQRTVAFAGKINLYSESDPLSDPDLDDIILDYRELKDYYKTKIKDLKLTLSKSNNIYEIRKCKTKMSNYTDSLFNISSEQASFNDEVKNQYYKDNWNASAVDLGFGRVYNYNIETDSMYRLNDGLGMWLNGSKDLGRNFQLTGMMKFMRFNQFDIHFLLGTNLRYGNPRFNFYSEIVYDCWSNPTASLNPEFKEVRQLEKVTIGYGGELKLNNIIQLNFGVRTNLDQHFKLASILPTANILCLMPL
jgi:hypothetical protein